MYRIKVRFARDSSFEVTLTAHIYGFRLRFGYIGYLDRGADCTSLLPLITIMTFFDTLSRSYADVDTSNGIDTDQFLEASSGLVKMFG
jgi:hypothetical protein